MDIIDFARDLQSSSDQRGHQVYVMYHGTTYQNALKIKRNGFNPSSDGMLGRGVYVSRSFQKASAYPITLPAGEEKVVLKLKVRVGKVKRIDCQGHPLQKSWHQAGYDTAWVPPNCGMVPSGLEEDCVWDPERIEVTEILNMDGTVKDDTGIPAPPAPLGVAFHGIPAPQAPLGVPFHGIPGPPAPLGVPFHGIPGPPAPLGVPFHGIPGPPAPLGVSFYGIPGTPAPLGVSFYGTPGHPAPLGVSFYGIPQPPVCLEHPFRVIPGPYPPAYMPPY